MPAPDTGCPHGSHPSFCLDCMEGPSPLAGQIDAAVGAALRQAPAVARADPGDDTDRGIDVAFTSQADAERARDQINQSLESSASAGLVSAWVWTPGSDGDAQTEAGRTTGREIRLQTNFTDRKRRPST
ncbi:MAG: hypothetical protein ACE367_25315 [Acidimicrobiales bacterium]